MSLLCLWEIVSLLPTSILRWIVRIWGVVRRVFVACLKEGLSIVDSNLFHDTTSSKHPSMVSNVTSVDCLQRTPIFYILVNCFLSTPDTLLHVFCLWWVSYMSWTLTMKWALSDVSIVSLNSFIFIQESHQGQPEDCDVVEPSSRKGSINPHKVSSLDTDSKLIP